MQPVGNDDKLTRLQARTTFPLSRLQPSMPATSSLPSRISSQVRKCSLGIHRLLANVCLAEIYHIVSQKAVDNDVAQANIGPGPGISLSKPAADDAAKGGKCC